MVQDKLFELQDLKYKAFVEKLTPSVKPENIIGVRVPVLRSFAKNFAKTPETIEFIKELPHIYYEENNLHAFIVQGIKDYQKCIDEIERFLPYVDNWATCDMMRPGVFAKHKDKLLIRIDTWLKSCHTYTIRFGIEMLMNFYLANDFKADYLSMVARIRSDEYYVNMMKAWFFAEALAKQWDSAVVFIENGSLDLWTHNKTIQKAKESYRISDERKAYLNSLKKMKAEEKH